MSITKVAIIGAGLMGAGIAQSLAASTVLAQKGLNVVLVDKTEDRLANGRQIITSSLARIAKKKFDSDAAKAAAYVEGVMSHVHFNTDAGVAVKDADLVVEAVVENLDLKQKLFRELDSRAPKTTIFASNTSSLPISEIAKATLSRRDRFAGLHFFNPVPQMKLVEIVRTNETSDEVFGALKTLVADMGKVGVECKDTPGFIVNRLLVPYILESIRLVDRGDASKEDVDAAMKLGAGYPMGPFELADYVGLDTIKFIAEGWYKSGKGVAGKEIVAVPESLARLVEEGKFGRKNGQGYYSYKK